LMLDAVTNRIVSELGLNAAPMAVAIAPSGSFAYAVGSYGNNDEGELFVIAISPE
jgi:hypothetical protein